MIIDAAEFAREFLREQPLSVALLLIVLDIPRHTFSIIALLFFRYRLLPQSSFRAPTNVTALVPSYNAGAGVRRTVESLAADGIQDIVIINDGSDDDTETHIEWLQAHYPALRVIHHERRTGKSAAVNHGARLSSAELLLVVDADSVVQRGSVARLSSAFTDVNVAAASGNVLVANASDNPLTAVQSVEYMLSVTLGRQFLDYLGSVSCCSGAFSMFRRSTFENVGGMNVGPGEDLEITLRLRKAGYRVRFVRDAVITTDVPRTIPRLVRQRMRWDRDALCIRLFMYHQLSLRFKDEDVSDTLQRLDFILLELLPTLVFPFYIAQLVVSHGDDAWMLLASFYAALFWIYLANVFLGYLAAGRRMSALEISVFPLVPIYQGIIMKFVRFAAFTDEIIFSRSHRDPFVPERVRAALYGKRGGE